MGGQQRQYKRCSVFSGKRVRDGGKWGRGPLFDFGNSFNLAAAAQTKKEELKTERRLLSSCEYPLFILFSRKTIFFPSFPLILTVY